MIPSHIIQQKADRNRYCNSGATNRQPACLVSKLNNILAKSVEQFYFAIFAKLNSKHKNYASKQQCYGQVEVDKVVNSRKQLSPAGRICYELAMWLSVSFSLSHPMAR